jgi:hypothetical protein
VTAIANLKYNMLLDDNNIPLEDCQIPEKGASMRDIVTSTTLQEKIKTFAEFYRSEVKLEDYSQAFILNLRDPTNPISAASIRHLLTRLARNAKITGVRVHPHAFRHTLVGNLFKQGNNAIQVSSYVGHKNPSTTLDNYHVPTMRELTEGMNIPCMPDYVPPSEKKEEDNAVLELERMKTGACMDVITTIRKLIEEAAKAEASAVELDLRVAEVLPGLDDTLEIINASASCGTCADEGDDQYDDDEGDDDEGGGDEGDGDEGDGDEGDGDESDGDEGDGDEGDE